SLRFWQSILRRDPAVFEPAFPGARHAQAKLSFNVLRAKSGRILFDDESANMAVIVFRPNYFHVGDRNVADPAFAAVQHIMIAVTFGARFHTARIRTVPVFRQRETTDAFSRNQSRQPARMLLGCAEGMNRVNRER